MTHTSLFRSLRLLLLAIPAFCLAAPPAEAGRRAKRAAVADTPSTYIISLTVGTDDLFRAQMALQLGVEALKGGHPVKVFLHLNAVNLASTSLADADVLGTEPTVKALMQELIALGAEVLVCEQCMAFHRLTAADLIEGTAITEDHSLYPHLGPNTLLVNY